MSTLWSYPTSLEWKNLLYEKISKHIPALKWGREMEAEAHASYSVYIEHMKKSTQILLCILLVLLLLSIPSLELVPMQCFMWLLWERSVGDLVSIQVPRWLVNVQNSTLRSLLQYTILYCFFFMKSLLYYISFTALHSHPASFLFVVHFELPHFDQVSLLPRSFYWLLSLIVVSR